eukprot:1331080-Rhodomonas_salina.2
MCLVYAVCGTDIRARMLCHVRYDTSNLMLLRRCYALSGTELWYAATRRYARSYGAGQSGPQPLSAGTKSSVAQYWKFTAGTASLCRWYCKFVLSRRAYALRRKTPATRCAVRK